MRRCRALRRQDEGVLSLEFGLALPLLLLAVVAALQSLAFGRDVLLAHDAARAGARAAATSTGSAAVEAAVEESVGDRPAQVSVTPHERATGQLVTVTVQLSTRLGPSTLDVSATAASRVEPGVDP